VRLGAMDEQRLAGGGEVHDDDTVLLADELRPRGADQRGARIPPAAIAGGLGEPEERLGDERGVVERAIELLGRALVEYARDRIPSDHPVAEEPGDPASERERGCMTGGAPRGDEPGDREAVPRREDLVVGAGTNALGPRREQLRAQLGELLLLAHRRAR